MINTSKLNTYVAGLEKPYNAEPIQFDEGGSGQLNFDADFTLNIQVDRNTRQLILFVLLGPLPETQRPTVLTHALGAGLNPQQGQNFFLALEPKSNLLLIKQQLYLDRLEDYQLPSVLATLHRQAVSWRHLLHHAAHCRDEPAAVPREPSLNPADHAMLFA